MDNGMIGKYVIVRCRDAGVHCGVLEAHEGREALLIDSRRLWYWKPAKGKFLSASLTPIQGGFVPKKGLRYYILHAEMPSMAEHEEFDSNPVFTKFLAKAQAMQAEDPTVWFGETLFQV